MLIIGVTGTIASGKSTVDGMLLDLGATAVIDADHTVHDLLREDPDVRAGVLRAFGQDVFTADGVIDRRALGAIVFGDPRALQQLEAIIHPAVRRRIRAQLAALPEDSLVVVDAVKLLEGDLAKLAQSVWWVTTTPEQQLQRLVQSRGMSEVDARARLAVQPVLDRWRERVDVVIDNSGSLAETRNQVFIALSNVLAANRRDGGASQSRE